MITTRFSNGRVFLHNGDFSGDLLINVAPSEVEKLDVEPGMPPTMRVTIPFDDIKAIVDQYVRRMHASRSRVHGSRRCEAQTNNGLCGLSLDDHGYCGRPGDHISDAPEAPLGVTWNELADLEEGTR